MLAVALEAKPVYERNENRTRMVAVLNSWTIPGLFVTALAATLTLGACSKDSGLSGKNSVWDTYDFRHPVPYGAPVPDSRATVYDQYQDYEEYYTPPKGYAPPAAAAPAAPYADYEEYYVPPRGYGQPAGGNSDYESYYTPPQRQRNYNPCIPGDPGCIAGR